METPTDIWRRLPDGFTALAPMDGVTDAVFRQVVAAAARPDLFFTEFTNVSSFASERGRANATARLATTKSDAPIIAQLWGTSPEHMGFCAQRLPQGFAGIDINMGCPEKHVVSSGGGSALIRAPRALTADLIAAAKTGGIPVSVKTRLGYSRTDEWREWLGWLLSQNISALTVHLRTKKEMSKVPAHHELIPDIIALRDQLAPKTTLLVNGDFASAAHFRHVLEEQGVASCRRLGVMIGRGVFADPFCFEQSPRPHTRDELIALLHYHLDLYDRAYPGGTAKFAPLKRFFKIYINSFDGAADLRTALMETTTTAQVRALLPSGR